MGFFNEETNHYERTEGQQSKPTKKTIFDDLTEADHKTKLNLIFNAVTEITYTELVEEIKRFYGVGTNLAKQKILPFLLAGKFLNNNKGIYKLN